MNSSGMSRSDRCEFKQVLEVVAHRVDHLLDAVPTAPARALRIGVDEAVEIEGLSPSCDAILAMVVTGLLVIPPIHGPTAIPAIRAGRSSSSSRTKVCRPAPSIGPPSSSFQSVIAAELDLVVGVLVRAGIERGEEDVALLVIQLEVGGDEQQVAGESRRIHRQQPHLLQSDPEIPAVGHDLQDARETGRRRRATTRTASR